MNSHSTTEKAILTIAEKVSFDLEDYHIKILSYLGCFTPQVFTFKVECNRLNFESNQGEIPQLGLLRVGDLSSGLVRELEIRKALKNYGLIVPLLAQIQKDSVVVDVRENSHFEQLIEKDQSEIEIVENQTNMIFLITEEDIKNHDNIEKDTDDYPRENIEQEEINEVIELEAYKLLEKDDMNPQESDLEEEYLPEYILEEELENPSTHILLLSEFPSFENSLESLIEQYSYQESVLDLLALNLIIQLCQCCSYLSERKWHLINLVPTLTEFKERLMIYDLTQIFPEKDILSTGLNGAYCAPELATSSPIDELMSSYTVGALLYKIIHHQLPNHEDGFDIKVSPIPQVYQLLKKVLSPIPEERLTLVGLRQLLLKIRQEITLKKVSWNMASSSTVGLSLERLQNEDYFGFKQQQINAQETLMIAVVADGMGGMAKGEVASRIAVETVLNESILTEFKDPQERNNWLVNVFQKANQAIASEVDNGGTTLSVVLALNEQLMIGHVGDSRIYLLRQGNLEQISQDHSYVALLVNNGEITEEESKNHPDRSLLLRSLGSKNTLSHDYVQNLTATTNHLVLTLENNDLLLLCSDGIWDLISQEKIQDIFSDPHLALQDAVNLIIDNVLEAGASDNATILALEYNIVN
ncbi:MAG: protein phosphatase 2C domain-containing protein [Crocosphaera sp.]|nr:protein phosphatase 2C domain-containing protein [Crocosphaera sp.]